MKIPMGKARPVERPYEVHEGFGPLDGWRWLVLKKWQADDAKPYARALCYVTSPYTGSGGDMGDVYIRDYDSRQGARYTRLVREDVEVTA